VKQMFCDEYLRKKYEIHALYFKSLQEAGDMKSLTWKFM
jgi:hypothetical protein